MTFKDFLVGFLIERMGFDVDQELILQSYSEVELMDQVGRCGLLNQALTEYSFNVFL